MAAMKGLFALGGAGLAGFYLGTQQRPVQSHCQVPCGIYDDSGRIAGMKEDVNTISKAIKQVRVSPPHFPSPLANDVSWLARPFHCPTRYIYIHTYRLTRDCLVCFSCFFLHIKGKFVVVKSGRWRCYSPQPSHAVDHNERRACHQDYHDDRRVLSHPKGCNRC